MINANRVEYMNLSSSNAPAVSIVVPIYNKEKYLSKLLRDLVNQTLYDIEILCIDDGSTDSSKKIITKYQQKDSRIKYFYTTNRGLSAARNEGIMHSTGKYIGFVDADDRISLKMYECLWKNSEKNHADICICGGKVRGMFSPSWIKNALNTKDDFFPYFDGNVLFKRNTTPFIWRTMIRTSFIKDNNYLFDVNLKIGEDLLFLFEIIPFSKNIVLIGKKLYSYNWSNSDSLMNKNMYNNRFKKVEYNLEIIHKIVNYWSKYNFFELQVDLWNYIKSLFESEMPHLKTNEKNKLLLELDTIHDSIFMQCNFQFK